MKDKVLQEIKNWCEENNIHDHPSMEQLFHIMFEKTSEALLEDVKDEFKQEFDKGNLQHSFIISSDYYLDLKMKELNERWKRSLSIPSEE